MTSSTCATRSVEYFICSSVVRNHSDDSIRKTSICSFQRRRAFRGLTRNRHKSAGAMAIAVASNGSSASVTKTAGATDLQETYWKPFREQHMDKWHGLWTAFSEDGEKKSVRKAITHIWSEKQGQGEGQGEGQGQEEGQGEGVGEIVRHINTYFQPDGSFMEVDHGAYYKTPGGEPMVRFLANALCWGGQRQGVLGSEPGFVTEVGFRHGRQRLRVVFSYPNYSCNQVLVIKEQLSQHPLEGSDPTWDYDTPVDALLAATWQGTRHAWHGPGTETAVRATYDMGSDVLGGLLPPGSAASAAAPTPGGGSGKDGVYVRLTLASGISVAFPKHVREDADAPIVAMWVPDSEGARVYKIEVVPGPTLRKPFYAFEPALRVEVLDRA
eukprot:jgi/Mesen1/7533/ME000391S06775